MSSFEIHKQNELRKREIEVKALVALTQQDVIVHAKMEAVHKLIEIAYPEKVAEQINTELSEYYDKELSEYEWFVNVANNEYQKAVDLLQEVIADIVSKH